MAHHLRSTLLMFVRFALALGLLLLGWGVDDLGGFFRHPARSGLVVLFVLSSIYFVAFFCDLKVFRKGWQPVGRQRWLPYISAAAGILLVWFLPYGDRRGLLVFPDSNVLRYAGLALAAGGEALRLAALQALGKQYSAYVTLQEGHQLIQSGVYGRLRHPFYLGTLLIVPGLGLIFRSWLVVPILVSTLLFVFLRMHQEEKLLGQHFGSDFEAYCRRTWRLLPYIY